ADVRHHLIAAAWQPSGGDVQAVTAERPVHLWIGARPGARVVGPTGEPVGTVAFESAHLVDVFREEFLVDEQPPLLVVADVDAQIQQVLPERGRLAGLPALQVRDLDARLTLLVAARGDQRDGRRRPGPARLAARRTAPEDGAKRNDDREQADHQPDSSDTVSSRRFRAA